VDVVERRVLGLEREVRSSKLRCDLNLCAGREESGDERKGGLSIMSESKIPGPERAATDPEGAGRFQGVAGKLSRFVRRIASGFSK